MVLLMLSVLGWHHPAWGPLLHEISWPLWALLVTLAIAEVVNFILKIIEGLLKEG